MLYAQKRTTSFGLDRKARVLVVDDSVVVRRFLMQTLERDAFDRFDVVGYASSAELALQKIKSLSPDILTLDIHMSGMSGFDLLTIIQREHSHLKTLLFSSDMSWVADRCMDALMRGNVDFLLKPVADTRIGDTLSALREQVTEKISALVGFAAAKRDKVQDRGSAVATSGYKKTHRAPRVLAIGVSTGGPVALTHLIGQLPTNFPLPVVIVQHMPPVFTDLLAKRIQSVTGFQTVEAVDGMDLEPGKALLAPGNFHMRCVTQGLRTVVQMDQGAYECSCRPSVDVLFRSVHQVFGGDVLAVILTGMGQDGLKGVELLAAAGAYVIAQSEATSTVWGMPGAIAQAGLADEVLDLDLIGDAILRIVSKR